MAMSASDPNALIRTDGVLRFPFAAEANPTELR
jgi:hypothetical protein